MVGHSSNRPAKRTSTSRKHAGRRGMRAEACTCWSVAWVVGCAKCDQAVWHRGAYLVGMHLWPMPWPIESKTSKHEFNPFRGVVWQPKARARGCEGGRRGDGEATVNTRTLYSPYVVLSNYFAQRFDLRISKALQNGHENAR